MRFKTANTNLPGCWEGEHRQHASAPGTPGRAAQYTMEGKRNMLGLITYLALVLMSGALWGLIPLLVGKSTGKIELGKLGMLCSILANLICMGVVAAVGFLIAILVRSEDIRPLFRSSAPAYQPPVQQPPRVMVGQGVAGLSLSCIAGPLVGQIYPIGQGGLTIGRGPGCGVHLPENTPGISWEHCAIRFQQGVPVLIDLNSSYGTFQGDGTKLPPQYPVQLAPGSRFYLGTPSCLFQVIAR